MLPSAAPPSRMTALLREQRYRRHFRLADRKQILWVIALTSITLYGTTRNDFRLLLDPSTMLTLALGARGMHFVATLSALTLLRRARRPREQDRATAIWHFATGLTLALVLVTRLPSGEFQGPFVAVGTLLCVAYFAQRGPIVQRSLLSFLLTILGIIIVWNPAASMTPTGRTTSTLAIVLMNVLGVVSARSFEEQRRSRFEAERQERRARKELSQRLEELAAEKERAEAMSRARTAFLATMSHEFRTPMNAIIGLSDLLVDTSLDDEHKEQVRVIRDSARSLLSLLNGILDFAKIDAGKLDLAPAPFDLPALASSVIDMMRPVAEARAIDLSLDLAETLPVCVLGDDARLRQVLVNLVSNAIKFTERGSVRLRIRELQRDGDSSKTEFRVEDTGIGIEQGAIDRLFLPFEQVDTGTTRRYGGTGLGLAISRQIVIAMGGDIRVESGRGKGTTFSFTLSLPVASSPRKRPSSIPVVRKEGKKSLAILVVDDQPVNLRVARAMFGRLGHDVHTASSGSEAVEAVSGGDYDAVFMDLQMPEMSGIETTRKIMDALPDERTPHIVAMTASVYEADRNACKQAGMFDFVGKPIDIAELEAVLSRIAEERDAHPPDARMPASLAREPLDKLRELERIGEPGFFASLCRDFIADAPARLERMRSALARADEKTLAIEAHGLKSVSASLGAMDMSALCAELEATARTGALEGVTQKLGALEKEFGRVTRALAREIEGGGEGAR